MTHAPPPAPTPPRPRFVAGCGLLLLAGLALLTIAGLIGYSLYRAVPADYARAQAQRRDTAPPQRHAVAESLENRVSAEITFASHIDDHGRPLPDTSNTRFILLTSAEINAWLDQRLPLWLKNRDIQLPAQVSDTTFWTRGDQLVLGARVRQGDFDHVVSFAIRLDVPEHGDEATVRFTSLRLGQLPVPLGMVRDKLGDEADRIIDGFTFPTVQVIGGQRARWVSIAPFDGGLLIELRRESPGYNQSP